MMFVDIMEKLNKGIDQMCATPVKMAADEILRLSNKEVPFDKGILSNSGRVKAFPRYVEVGYHTPYAHRLHEHPEYHFQNGRKGKYLEDPIKNNLSRLEKTIGTNLAVEMNI